MNTAFICCLALSAVNSQRQSRTSPWTLYLVSSKGPGSVDEEVGGEQKQSMSDIGEDLPGPKVDNVLATPRSRLKMKRSVTFPPLWSPDGSTTAMEEDVSQTSPEEKKQWPWTGSKKKFKNQPSVQDLAIASLGNTLMSVGPLNQKSGAQAEVMAQLAVDAMQEEVVISRERENTVELHHMSFPRPREQMVHQEGLGGGGIFSSSVARKAGSRKLTAERQPRDTTNKKMAYEALATAVIAGEEGEALSRRIQRAGGAKILGTVQVEMKGKAEATGDGFGGTADKAAKVRIYCITNFIIFFISELERYHGRKKAI